MQFKKITILLAIFLLNGFSLVAQDTNIDWYKTKSSLGKDYFNSLKVLKSNDKYIWYVRGTGSIPTHIGGGVYGNSLTLAKFDIEKDTTYTCEFKFKINEFRLDFNSIDLQNDVLNVFSTFMNRKEDKYYLFKESYNLNTLSSNNDISKVLEIDVSKKTGIKGLINFYFKPINDKYVCYYSCGKFVGENAAVEVFNQKFISEWKTFQPIEKGREFFSENCFKIDNQGNFYFLGQEYISSKEKRGKLSIVCFPRSGEKVKVIPLELENNYFVTAAHLAISKNNEIIVAGMYANNGFTSAIGCFSKIYNTKLTNEKSCQLEPLPTEILTKEEDEKVISLISKNKDFEEEVDYVCDSIHVKENGDFDYVVEKMRVVKKMNKVNGFIEYYYEYMFNDLYVTSYDSNGKVKWVQKVPKKTFLYESGSYLGGYVLTYDKYENLHLVFNKIHEKQTVFKDLTKPNRKGPTIYVVIDKNGNKKEIVLSDSPELSNYIAPIYAIKTPTNSILIPRFPFKLGGDMSKKNNFIEFGELKFIQ